MAHLEHSYISVLDDGGHSYGGSQMLSESKVMRDAGCGVIAAMDLLLYLGRFRPECRCSFFPQHMYDGEIVRREYDAMSRRFSARYMPVIPKFGVNGVFLAAGLDIFFIRYSIPYRAVWSIKRSAMWARIDEMLSQDLPVIISIGPNFPFFWRKNKLKFYRELPGGDKRASCEIQAHYVTVTGMDEKWLRISSWGREYYIDREEYTQYVNKHSSSIVSNIVHLKRIK